MSVGHPVLLLVAFLFLSSVSHGQDFHVNETVAVATDSTEVKSKQQSLGSIARDTKFSIRQKNGSWLLGEFKIDNKTVLGWVSAKSVRRVTGSEAVAKTHKFTWENLLLANVKLDKDFDFDANVDSFMQTFRKDVWNRYHDDEFQMRKKRPEALRIFKQRVKDFDLDQQFLLANARVFFDKYSFDHSAFPILEIDETNYWYKDRYTNGDFPSRMRVFFKNTEMMQYMPLPADDAERFLATRKNKRGNVAGS